MQPADWCVMVSASPVAAVRLDVSMRLSPEGLVGRFLRVYWEANDAWFAGSVVEYDQDTARHKVGHSRQAPAGRTHCTAPDAASGMLVLNAVTTFQRVECAAGHASTALACMYGW